MGVVGSLVDRLIGEMQGFKCASLVSLWHAEGTILPLMDLMDVIDLFILLLVDDSEMARVSVYMVR